MSQTCPKAEVVAPPSLVTSKSCHLQGQLRLGQRTLFEAIDKPEKARFPNRPSCRTRRKLAISAPRVGRLGRVICPTGSLLTPVSSPLCKNILLRHLVETDLLIPPSRPTRGALAIVTNVGMGCGGRGSVLRAKRLQGGFYESVSDQRAC